MTDPVKQAEETATRVSQQANSEVQAAGPGVVGFIKEYWPYIAGALVALALAHFVFGFNVGVAGF